MLLLRQKGHDFLFSFLCKVFSFSNDLVKIAQMCECSSYNIETSDNMLHRGNFLSFSKTYLQCMNELPHVFIHFVQLQ